MLILPAFADGPAGVPPVAPIYHTFIMMFLIIVIFYFLLIRPQKKRQEEHQTMIDGLKKGDDVITAGGLHAQVADVRDDHLVLKISDNVRVKATKTSITQKIQPPAQELPPGRALREAGLQ